jgi:imidazolonepropionase-like amidohydrolase
MTSRCTARRSLIAAVLLCASASAPGQAPARPELYVLENVRLAPDGEPLKLVLAEGRIQALVAADAANPPGARVADGQGGVVTPAFVDAYTRAGIETPVPMADRDAPLSTESDASIDMRLANRRGVQPAFHAVDALSSQDKHGSAAREQGFGVLCIAPSGHLLPGASAVVTTRAAAPRDTVLVPQAFDHAELRSSDGGYPSTLMGCVAQLRQFFLDATRHRELEGRQAAGRPGPRPPYDRDLEALSAVLDGQRRLVCHADSHRDIERWMALADGAGFEIAVTGGRDAWRLAPVLAERGIPIALTLDWGEEVKDPNEKKGGKKKPDEAESAEEGESEPEETKEAAPDEEDPWEYTEPLDVRDERRRLWEETRDCALRLHEAGVPFAFGSGGASPKELLERARELVEAGLPAEVALAALTKNAAEFIGLGDRLGGLEPGMMASLAVWTAAPTDKQAKLSWLFVEGFPHEFEIDDEEHGAPDEGVDASGQWTIEQDEVGTSTLELEMTAEGEVTGTLWRPDPAGAGEIEAPVTGWVTKKTLTLEGSFRLGDTDVSFSMEGELEGDAWRGTSTAKGPWGELERPFTAQRKPDQGEREVR